MDRGLLFENPRKLRRMSRTVNQQTSTAYHEAGHAVVCHLLGFRVHRVTIVPGDSFLGLCTHENILRRINLEYGNSDRCRMRLEKCIMVSLAGLIAQRLWRRRSVRAYHAKSDHKLAVDLAIRVCSSGPTATAYLQWLNLRTTDVLMGNWTRVEAMAADLLRQGTITIKPTTPGQSLTLEQVKFFWK